MATELFANDYITTLAASAGSADTTVTVTQAPPSALTATGQWRLLVDSEIMLVTGVSSTTLTVSRGQEGTNGASHAAGATATHILTAAALSNLTPPGGITEGVWSSRPAAGTAGRLYLASDGPYVSFDTGTAWLTFGPAVQMSPVISANFSWINQGSATETYNGGVACLSDPGGQGNTDSFRMRLMAYPSAPFTITMAFKVTSFGNNQPNAGIVLYNSSSTATYIQANYIASASYQSKGAWCSTIGGTFSGTFGAYTVKFFDMIWVQYKDDGTNRYFNFSTDGINFQTFYSESNTAHFTPNQIGYVLDNFGAASGVPAAVSVYSWSQS